MVKHTQIIRRLLPKNSLSVLDHFVGLAFKELNPIKVPENIISKFCLCNLLVNLRIRSLKLKLLNAPIILHAIFHLTITCPKLTKETLEQGLKYVQS